MTIDQEDLNTATRDIARAHTDDLEAEADAYALMLETAIRYLPDTQKEAFVEDLINQFNDVSEDSALYWIDHPDVVIKRLKDLLK
jgi:hypothetical protein